MKRSNVIVFVVILVAIGLVVLLMMNKDDAKNKNKGNSPTSSNNTSSSSNNSSTPPANSNSAATDQVAIQNFSFSPDTITVKAGTKVTWTNKDSVTHTVTADESSSDAPASSSIAPNETYSFTFSKAGTYAYHCTPHPSMRAKVVVTE